MKFKPEAELKPATIARKNREAIKQTRARRDLKILAGLVLGACRFSQATGQDQWITDRLNDLFSELDA